MICGMTYYQICWYFLIYSFGGWIVEVIFHAVTLGKVVNRGFLNGPVCPVYGFGVLSVFAAVNSMQDLGRQPNGLEVFLFGVILATAVELIAGWALDRCFHARWWDYSNRPLNFHGYICLEFSLIWGLAILLVVRVFQEYVEHQTFSTSPSLLGWIILGVLYLGYLTDFIVTVAIIQGFNRKLRQLDQIQSEMRIVSDHISEYVGTKTIETAQLVGEGKVQTALAKAEFMDAAREKREEFLEAGNRKKLETLEELREKRDALQKEFDELTNGLASRYHFSLDRLLKAFPDFRHKKYPDMIRLLKERL